ncbi:hypothetical protein [Saccharothrix sp. HUAS TT1]|uniref:hypothetical protein n=1 Tax=unclassified Saccharothrix TaxID=2593673 RepID=UPI00345BE761
MDEVPYQRTTAFTWTERAFALIESRELAVRTVVTDGIVAATVAGSCPRCGHHLVDNQVGTAVTPVRSVGVPDAPPTVVLDVSCGCGLPHTDAPEHVTGCGVGFRVQLTLQDQP